MLNKLLHAQSTDERDREVYHKFENKLKIIIYEAKAACLRNAVSQTRANPKLAAYMCKWCYWP